MYSDEGRDGWILVTPQVGERHLGRDGDVSSDARSVTVTKCLKIFVTNGSSVAGELDRQNETFQLVFVLYKEF